MHLNDGLLQLRMDHLLAQQTSASGKGPGLSPIGTGLNGSDPFRTPGTFFDVSDDAPGSLAEPRGLRTQGVQAWPDPEPATPMRRCVDRDPREVPNHPSRP